MRIVLATRNAKKLGELRRILDQNLGVGTVELVGLGDLPPYPESPETGLSFAENALAKAREAQLATGMVSVADDSGLAVDVLGGMPGIFSARWCGKHGDDLANLRLLLAQVADVPDEHLTAAFMCAVAMVLPDGREFVMHGRMPGHLVRSPRGERGFGYDPIFVADGRTVTNAELAQEEKDAISHRGKALRELVNTLSGLLPKADR